MKNWEDFTFIQKALIGVAVLAIAAFAPEIAMLLQFGGIEVVFTFLLLTFKPILLSCRHHYRQLSNAATIVVISLRHSASARPHIFALQASFCCISIALTGSAVFAFSFFMPGMLLNGVLA